MKIWVDILTPKQLVFFEPLIQKLKKNHKVLCTTRDYDQVKNLAKIRKFDIKVVGKFGGQSKSGKLLANLNRMNKLFEIIKNFNPDLTISFCSPDVSRISFGLGIKHVAYCDSPHAEAVMRLSIPLIQKLLVPWVIPKTEFTKYGIDSKNIFHYKAIDAAITLKRKYPKQKLKFNKQSGKRILIRMDESQSAYQTKSEKIIPIIKKIIEKFSQENIVILSRYPGQKQEIKKLFGKNAQILDMSFDGKLLLENADIFIGSGGTMTAESALLGVPTISYGAVPNIVEEYLIKKTLIKRESNPEKITKIIQKFLVSPNLYKKKAKRLLDSMENPHSKLFEILKLWPNF